MIRKLALLVSWIALAILVLWVGVGVYIAWGISQAIVK